MLRKQNLYYNEKSFIYAKSKNLTYLRNTKWAIETLSSNCFRFENIARCGSTWQSKAQGPNFLSLFSKQCLVDLYLRGFKSPETMRKLCLSTKFPHQEIR